MLETILYLILVLASASIGGGVGYVLRGRREARKLEERMETELLRKRNALLDRGRTTARRPEHDGETPARTRKLVIRNERPRPRR